jgi:hypothetical protein
MPALPLWALALLAGCAHAPAPPPRIETVTVKIPVPVYCVQRADIPPEPAKVGDRLTGNAAADIGPISISALELRKALREALALLGACTDPAAPAVHDAKAQ